jgi:hypothetical protein
MNVCVSVYAAKIVPIALLTIINSDSHTQLSIFWPCLAYKLGWLAPLCRLTSLIMFFN